MHSPSLVWGPLKTAGAFLLHHWPPWAAGRQLPYHDLHHRLQRDLCPGTGASPPPPSSLILVSAGLCLTYPHSSFQQLLSSNFFSLLKHVNPETLLVSWMHLALTNAGSVLESAGIVSIRYRGGFSQKAPSQEASQWGKGEEGKWCSKLLLLNIRFFIPIKYQFTIMPFPTFLKSLVSVEKLWWLKHIDKNLTRMFHFDDSTLSYVI